MKLKALTIVSAAAVAITISGCSSEKSESSELKLADAVTTQAESNEKKTAAPELEMTLPSRSLISTKSTKKNYIKLTMGTKNKEILSRRSNVSNMRKSVLEYIGKDIDETNFFENSDDATTHTTVAAN